MQVSKRFSIVVSAVMLFPRGLISLSWAQDRDQDRLKHTTS